MTTSVAAALRDLAGNVAGKRVVDLGAGREGFLPLVLRSATPLLALAVDLNGAALTERGDGSARVQADLSSALPFRTGSIDLLVSHNTLECLLNPEALLGECRRVVAAGGRMLMAHTEFESIAVNADDRDLCRRVIRAYADLPVLYRYMRHADPQMGRQLPGLVRQAGFDVLGVTPHVTIGTSQDGDAAERVAEMAASVRRGCERGLTTLTLLDIDRWTADLAQQDATGRFFFSETAYIVDARPSGAS